MTKMTQKLDKWTVKKRPRKNSSEFRVRNNLEWISFNFYVSYISALWVFRGTFIQWFESFLISFLQKFSLLYWVTMSTQLKLAENYDYLSSSWRFAIQKLVKNVQKYSFVKLNQERYPQTEKWVVVIPSNSFQAICENLLRIQNCCKRKSFITRGF